MAEVSRVTLMWTLQSCHPSAARFEKSSVIILDWRLQRLYCLRESFLSGIWKMKKKHCVLLKSETHRNTMHGGDPSMVPQDASTAPLRRCDRRSICDPVRKTACRRDGWSQRGSAPSPPWLRPKTPSRIITDASPVGRTTCHYAR